MMEFKDSPPAIATESVAIAEQAAIERLLNAYLREQGIADPRLVPTDSAFRIALAATQQGLAGHLRYWSMGGHHVYGSQFWRFGSTDSGNQAGNQADDPLSLDLLIQLLLDELAAGGRGSGPEVESHPALVTSIWNSLNNTRRYVQHFQQFQGVPPVLDWLASERSLYFGHPFHPTPKSAAGFADDDLPRYAPELQAVFVPHFWAIAPELLQEDWLSDRADWPSAVIPSPVQQAARQRLTPRQANYGLIPCHPWQADHLRQHPLVRSLQTQGQLVDLGAIGAAVWPTASVRTVWQPNHGYFYKLPLAVRITNFIRVNPIEQMQRAVDAGKILAAIGANGQGDRFRILMEVGYRTLKLPALREQFGVVFRAAPSDFIADRASIFMVASLLEAFPGASEPKLFQAIRQTNQGQMVDLRRWLRRYLDCSLQPLLHLLADYGIGLEAHVQNSLIRLQDGWPQCLYVRDLEGMSVDHTQAAGHGWYNQAIEPTSPLLYSPEATWERWQYYVVVNHLGHLLATLGRYGPYPETTYWQIVQTALQSELSHPSGEGRQRLMQRLLHQPTLPAKANLLSRFQQRSERPLYVAIPNPIAGKGQPFAAVR